MTSSIEHFDSNNDKPAGWRKRFWRAYNWLADKWQSYSTSSYPGSPIMWARFGYTPLPKHDIPPKAEPSTASPESIRRAREMKMLPLIGWAAATAAEGTPDKTSKTAAWDVDFRRQMPPESRELFNYPTLTPYPDYAFGHDDGRVSVAARQDGIRPYQYYVYAPVANPPWLTQTDRDFSDMAELSGIYGVEPDIIGILKATAVRYHEPRDGER